MENTSRDLDLFVRKIRLYKYFLEKSSSIKREEKIGNLTQNHALVRHNIYRYHLVGVVSLYHIDNLFGRITDMLLTAVVSDNMITVTTVIDENNFWSLECYQ